MVLVVLALAGILFFALLPKQSGGPLRCTVSQNGQTLDRFAVSALSGQTRIYGAYAVTVGPEGTVAVTAAPCANQDCVRTGRIRRGGQSIVCLPGRFVVELSGGEGDDGVDLVAR